MTFCESLYIEVMSNFCRNFGSSYKQKWYFENGYFPNFFMAVGGGAYLSHTDEMLHNLKARDVASLYKSNMMFVCVGIFVCCEASANWYVPLYIWSGRVYYYFGVVYHNPPNWNRNGKWRVDLPHASHP